MCNNTNMGTNNNHTATVHVRDFRARWPRYTNVIPRFGPLTDTTWIFEDGVKIRFIELSERREAGRKARVYVSTGEAFDLAEDLANRERRPHKAYRPGVIDALDRIGVTDVRLNWSKHAGCASCPCSPGFIITGGPVGGDFFIELPGAPSVDESKPARFELEGAS